MSLEFKVWLYGTSTSKSKETFVKLPDTALSKAKGFHLFVRESSGDKWQRITSEVETFPSGVRSKTDKEIYIDLFKDTVGQEFAPKKTRIAEARKPSKPAVKKPAPKKPSPKKPAPKKAEPKKPAPKKPAPKKPAPKKAEPKKPAPKKPAPKKAEPKKAEPEIAELPIEVELPSLPKKPRVTLSKKQFNAQMSRIIFDELDMEKMKWSGARIDSFIDKLWRGYSHAPHLIASENFKRSLVTQEIKRIKDRKAKKKRGEMEESFRKELEAREVSLDPGSVKGEVKVQFKEVFNTQYLKPPLTPEEEKKLTPAQKKERKKQELTIKTLQDGFVVDKERQSLFAQIIVDYDQAIVIGKEAVFAKNEIEKMAFNKVRVDMEKLFDEAVQKGLFKPGNEPEYSFRLLVPLLDAKGEIPTTALSKKGKQRVGHGFSTSRVKIKTKKDLKDAMDELYQEVAPALARYIRINNAAGFMISGFSIERIIR